MRKAGLNSPGNLVAVFGAMLASFGGALGSADTATKERNHSDGRKGFSIFARPVSSDDHYIDGHGCLRRRNPKRDIRMSARQWKKMVKAKRRETVAS